MFRDRSEAGHLLAAKLVDFKNRADVIVLALPRGGVVLGEEVSRGLNAPLDLILVRKLGVPGQEELAFGAIALNGIKVINQSIVTLLQISSETIDMIIQKEEQELIRRNHVYRQDKPFPNLEDKTVILVDDGVATGATMRAAIRIVHLDKPKKIVVATPLASKSIYQDMGDEDIELIVLETPDPFYGIGMWYAAFPQLTDDEVVALLSKANSVRNK